MISVVIPVRNDEKNLKILLSQIKKKCKKKNYEIIVVDGYSTDKSREVAKKFGARVVLQDKILGVANAKNVGVKNAKYDLILFLEADHRIKTKEVFFRLEKEFRKNRYDAATVFIWPLVPKRKLSIKEKFILSELISGFTYLKTHKEIPFSTTISMIKKSIFQKVGGYKESLGYGEDQEFALRVRRMAKNVGVIRNSGIYSEPILSFRRLFKQALWYGRNLPDYISHTKDFLKILWIISNVMFFPSVFLAIFSETLAFKFLFLLLALPPILRFVKWSLKTKLVLYSFFAMLVKIIRSWMEIIGMLSRTVIKHKGR